MPGPLSFHITHIHECTLSPHNHPLPHLLLKQPPHPLQQNRNVPRLIQLIHNLPHFLSFQLRLTIRNIIPTTPTIRHIKFEYGFSFLFFSPRRREAVDHPDHTFLTRPFNPTPKIGLPKLQFRSILTRLFLISSRIFSLCRPFRLDLFADCCYCRLQFCALVALGGCVVF